MSNNPKSEKSNKDSSKNSLNQTNDSKASSRPSVKKTQVKRKIPAEIVAKYIAAMNAYDALGSDENYKHLEIVKKEYKDFLESNQ